MLRMEIPLTRGMVAYIDDADAVLVLQYKWHAHESESERFYAAAYGGGGRRNRRYIYMHRLITGSDFTDHWDGDGLNNRRKNLRPCTESQNHCNRRKSKGTSSQFKGVWFDKSRKKWAAEIKLDRKKRFLGRFDTEEEAAEVRRKIPFELHGEFAKY
jgi:hypothetical protein